MQAPSKRQKISTQSRSSPSANFLPLGPRDHTRRETEDRPHSRHALIGFEPWILVKTKFRRRFVHNTQTKESYWRIPENVLAGVIALERAEKAQASRTGDRGPTERGPSRSNLQTKTKTAELSADSQERDRRRRSESLQREDEAAMLAELAAEAPETGANTAVGTVQQGPNPEATIAYDSEGSYEEIEITDSEWEEEGDEPSRAFSEGRASTRDEDGVPREAPVEFGEADIAFQLAAMGEDHDLDPGEYGDNDEEADGGEAGLPLTEQDAINLFRDLLDDYRISPFTPWEKLISDESETSILNDDRYTILPTMRARKEAWDAWAKDRAAQIKQERATMEQRDPRPAYLAFLQERATPKLYWPEFKRKFKREAEMSDRKLSDKDREKLYREHVNRLKLPESTRKGDLMVLLRSIPLRSLHKGTSLDSLPEELVSHLHFISLAPAIRDPIIVQHIRTLPPPPEADDQTEEQRADETKRRDERRRREQAMAERERRVEEEKRKSERDIARARLDLREGERELERATTVRP